MAEPKPYRSKVPIGRTGFWSSVQAESTKLISVRRWAIGMLGTIGLTLLISLLTAAGSGSDLNEHPDELGAVGPNGTRVKDYFHFVHQPLTGDGTVTARVTAQGKSHEWAKAGVMIKESTAAGAPYTAAMVTPGHGVRLQSDFTLDLEGSGATAPRWLRIARAGNKITGSESADGTSWSEIGTVNLAGLPDNVEVGLFVTSPDEVVVEQRFGSASSGNRPTMGTATFDNVSVEAEHGADEDQWSVFDSSRGYVGGGDSSEEAGVFKLEGSGDIAENPPDDDVAQLSFIGITIGQIAAIVVSVLFITSEYRRDLIRTTFATTPRRGRVLAAKATVIGAATFVVGVIASVSAFLLTQPVLRGNGFGPPGYPASGLLDPPVMRAVIGAAASLALIAIFSLALGTIIRRSSGAIAIALVVFLAPVLFSTAVPLTVAQWLVRLSPVAGFSITQTLPVDRNTAVEPWSMTGPWAGIGVLGAYVVLVLVIATFQLRSRDA